MTAVRVPTGHVTHRPEGSSRSLGSTGSGRSSSSCAGSTGTSRPPPGRRRARLPGSPGRQTPTLEGRTEEPRSRGPPSDARARQGLPARGVSGRDLGGALSQGTEPPDAGGAPRVTSATLTGPGRGEGGRGPPGRLGHALSSTKRWRGVQTPSGEGAYPVDSSVSTGLGQEQEDWWLGRGGLCLPSYKAVVSVTTYLW